MGLQIRQKLSSLGPIFACGRPKSDRLPAPAKRCVKGSVPTQVASTQARMIQVPAAPARQLNAATAVSCRRSGSQRPRPATG